MFVNIDEVNAAMQIKCYSMANQYMHLALVNMGKYPDAYRDPVCGHARVRASPEMRAELQVTVSIPGLSASAALVYFLCASSTGSNNQLLMFDTETIDFPLSALQFSLSHLQKCLQTYINSVRHC